MNRTNDKAWSRDCGVNEHSGGGSCPRVTYPSFALEGRFCDYYTMASRDGNAVTAFTLAREWRNWQTRWI